MNPATTRSALLLITALSLVQACAIHQQNLPQKQLAEPSACSEPTHVSRIVAEASTSTSGANGILMLNTGRQALMVRAALIEAAECSIDAQYYIWNSDVSGRYLAHRLLLAAERGVRVRLLLDDVNVGAREGVLAALAAHGNVSIEVYNPFAQRRGLRKALNFLREFGRLNRRMHVKSFTADRSVTILGGRNIGDEYFDLNSAMNFRDRDVLAVGPVVEETVAMFQSFWNWRLSRPVSELTRWSGATAPRHDQAAERVAAAEISAVHHALPRTPGEGARILGAALTTMIRAPARLLHDPPPQPDAIASSELPQPGSQALGVMARAARSEILIESAYLVLDDDELASARQLRDNGVQIRALTNSLASNDVTANHAAYTRARKQMLHNGIEVYELRPDAASCAELIENRLACGPQHVLGLHAKTFVIDKQTVYIGSLNLNLRSRYLNAESGLVIDSPQLAQQVASDIQLNMKPANSWAVALDERAKVRWHGGPAAAAEDWTHEPEVGWWRRTKVRLIAMWPLEKYL